MRNDKITTHSDYLKGLNTLRFLLALLVLLQHCNANLAQNGINWFFNIHLLNNGEFAVECFFILSGFLLTHLSIHEIRQNQFFNIKYFFLRRIFRIFPLYYLSVFISFILLGGIYPVLMGENYLAFSFQDSILYYIFFLPHLVVAIWTSNLGTLHGLWSIGVEEQFYITFPFLIVVLFRQKGKSKYVLLILILYFFFYWLIDTQIIETNGVIQRFVYRLKFHFMIYGSLLAFLLSKYNHQISKISNYLVVQVVIIISFLYVILINIPFDSYNILQGVIFGFVMLLVSQTSNKNLNLEIPSLIYLGSISYGIYIYHGMLSYPLRFLLEKSSKFYTIINSVPFIYYLLELCLTIMVAHYSYQYFEKYFLKLKKRYY